MGSIGVDGGPKLEVGPHNLYSADLLTLGGHEVHHLIVRLLERRRDLLLHLLGLRLQLLLELAQLGQLGLEGLEPPGAAVLEIDLRGRRRHGVQGAGLRDGPQLPPGAELLGLLDRGQPVVALRRLHVMPALPHRGVGWAGEGGPKCGSDRSLPR